MAEKKKTTSDESVENSGEDFSPSHLAKKKLKMNINSDTEVGKERKEGKGNVDKGIKETSNNDVHVYVKGQKLATVLDLFMSHRQNITVDGITYSCGVPKEKKHKAKPIQYMKVYRCLTVRQKDQKGKWVKMAKHRDKSNSDFISCEGRIECIFEKDRYWFKTKQCNTCNKGGGTGQARDHRQKIQMFSPAPMWNITRKNIRRMRAVLENCCTEGWWGNLPNQGTDRQ